MTKLADNLSATAQETSKHLIRLGEAKLVEKSSNGSYRLTSYAKNVLALLPSLDFTFRNRDYFVAHDISYLPQEFLCRICEISENEYADHASRMLSHGNRAVSEANEYVLAMIDDCWSEEDYDKILDELTARRISFKYISSTRFSRENYRYLRDRTWENMELRELEDVKMFITMNEKTAGICFPDLSGRIDLSRGFISQNTGFRRWCRDVFMHYWNKARRMLPKSLLISLVATIVVSVANNSF